MERQPTEWEGIVANGLSDTGLISKVYEELIQLNTEKKNSKQWAEDLNKQFFKEEDGQQTDEKLFNVTNHQRNTN